ncbi:hypothetical protein RJ641_028542 [Dillenia turbinata]|uniref:Importin N-terminal domain-containing protein n=1 Tax=Dillenia turbinata TaxID=194707 RepID=A0AAN8W0K2_9MAGN
MAVALSALDLPVIYTMLSNSLSGEKACGNRQRVHFRSSSLILEVIIAKDLTSATDIRLLATVYFKNSISRYRRNRRDSSFNSVDPNMKSHFKVSNARLFFDVSPLPLKQGSIDFLDLPPLSPVPSIDTDLKEAIADVMDG